MTASPHAWWCPVILWAKSWRNPLCSGDTTTPPMCLCGAEAGR